jgi:hypothetical protein
MKTAPLNKIFLVGHGNKFDLNKMSNCPPSEDAVAFIGRTGERNGLVAFVERLEEAKPYDAGLITVALGGSALSSFVQPRPFYTAQNIDVLTPRTPMSLDIRLYYCLCVEANRFRYSTFGREANRTLKNLPVPIPEDVESWVSGATERAIEGLRQNLYELVAQPESAIGEIAVGGAVLEEKVLPGPKPDVLKIDMGWEAAVKQSLGKKKPAEGWPK